MNRYQSSLSNHGSVTFDIKPCAPCAGFMTTQELKKFESLHSDFNKYWMPLTWFSNLASRAREEGRVRDDIALRLLMDVSVCLFEQHTLSIAYRQKWKHNNNKIIVFIPDLCKVFTVFAGA